MLFDLLEFNNEFLMSKSVLKGGHVSGCKYFTNEGEFIVEKL